MTIRTIIAVLAATAVLEGAGARAEDMFRVNFRATCRSLGDDGRLDTTRLTERDIIRAATGVSNSATRQFTLVYNATTDSIQVATTNGTVVADVIQFQGGASTSDGRRSSRLTFMFVPNQTNAIGSAVINERATSSQNGNETNRAAISGIVQFALTDDLTLGQTNASTGTNTGVAVPTPITGTNSSNDTNLVSGMKIVVDTNTVVNTNDVGGGTNTITDTNNVGGTNGTTNPVVGTGNASNSGFFFSNSALIQSNGLTNVRICVGTFNTTRRVSENGFTPVVNTNETGNATNNISGTNNITGTNNVTGTNNISGTNNITGTNNVTGTNTVSGIPGGVLGSPLTNLFSRIRP